MHRLIEDNSFYWLIAMALLYLFGVVLYATRTPERFFRKKIKKKIFFLGFYIIYDFLNNFGR